MAAAKSTEVDLDNMKRRLKEMEGEAAALCEMQGKVEKEMGSVQGAWPVLIDEFVEHMYRISGSNKDSNVFCSCGDSESQLYAHYDTLTGESLLDLVDPRMGSNYNKEETQASDGEAFKCRSQNKTKKKGNKKAGPDAISMKLMAQKANPFETIWSRRKFDIRGKKRKGEERRVGLARSLAIQKRKKTLLKEFEQSTKSYVFVDKRIGEQNDDLGEFEKGIMQSQRERQLKLGKKSKFNLSDGEEDEFDAPGFGSLPERDDFEEEMLSDDDKRPAILKQLNAHCAQNPLEGSLVEGEENIRPILFQCHKMWLKLMAFMLQKHKPKKEIMEVILKSKYFKAKKARDKEENEQLMEELDKNFTSLVQSQVLLSLTEPGKKNALKALEQPDSYDKLVNEMVLNVHARPSDRTKMPEEIAHEERERLERLEEERQNRMLVMDYSSDEDGENVEKDSAWRPRSISGDDLGDLFALDEEPSSKKGWVDEILERKDADDSENEDEDASKDSESAEGEDEGSEEDDDNECEKTSLKDWEQSDDDKLDTGLNEDEEVVKHDDATELGKEDVHSVDAKEIKSSVKHTSENCSNDDVIVIINRIRTSNAIKLVAENRKKMQVFYGVLLQYFAVLANRKPLNFELLNLLVKLLMEMSMEIPYFSAICARQRILRTRIQFCEALKNQEIGCWPTLKTLFLLRLWSVIFPCSDFHHVVMTPAILLMCEYLMRCPIMLGRDVAIGSFLCSMVLMVTKQSRKFCPEAIMFLRTLLMAATDQKLASEQDSQFYHHMELKALRPLLRIHDCVGEIKIL
ncbi:hypothetical protein CRYUN_Cryun04dG0193300 [Craigia yunnanensis]